MPLTREQINALLSENDGFDTAYKRAPGRIKTQYPPRNSKHVKFSEKDLPCHSYGCKVQTTLRFDELPYCCLHIIFVMVDYIARLEGG